MKKQRTYYLHTLEGLPAGFFNGRVVCFARKRVPLASSLRQLRREQAISKSHDDERAGVLEYGYATVTLPKS